MTAGARRLTPPRPTRCAGDPSSSGAWRPRPTQPPPPPPPGPPRTRWRDSWPTPRTARRSRRRSRRGGGGAGYSRTAPTSSSCCSITATRFDADPPADQARTPLRPPPPTAARRLRILAAVETPLASPPPSGGLTQHAVLAGFRYITSHGR
jgi:hypothetical protein